MWDWGQVAVTRAEQQVAAVARSLWRLTATGLAPVSPAWPVHIVTNHQPVHWTLRYLRDITRPAPTRPPDNCRQHNSGPSARSLKTPRGPLCSRPASDIRSYWSHNDSYHPALSRLLASALHFMSHDIYFSNSEDYLYLERIVVKVADSHLA